MYLGGAGSFIIAAKLNEEGIPTATGTTWKYNTITNMLKNEKYKGDYLLQKYYTPDGEIRKFKVNNGEVKAYYIKDNHPAIINTGDWDKVQEIMEDRKKERSIGTGGTEKYANRYPLSGMLVCPYCGNTLKRTQGYKKRIEWRCSTYIKEGKKACKGVKINDGVVSKKNFTVPTVIEEVIINGEKHYSYTSKTDYDRGAPDKAGATASKDGSVLSSVHRPRRAAIKL